MLVANDGAQSPQWLWRGKVNIGNKMATLTYLVFYIFKNGSAALV